MYICLLSLHILLLFHIVFVTEEIDRVINGISTPKSGGGGGLELDGDKIPFWERPQELKPSPWKDVDIEAVNSGGANLSEKKKSNYDF